MASLSYDNRSINDWLEEAIRRLDTVLSEQKQLADEFDIFPSKWAVVSAKAFLAFVYEHACSISIPSIWLGPNGTIGITWIIKNGRLDVQISELKTQAHFSAGAKSEAITPSEVSSLLNQIAA